MQISRIFAAIFLATAALLPVASPLLSQTAPAKPLPAQAVPAKSAPVALLPEVFAGWASAEPPKLVTDPALADPAIATALKEYAFTDAASATYSRSGETLTLRALRFHDASGAFGAYSFYRPSGWPKEQIGSGAASNHNRVLCWQGNVVLDATFSRIGPMSGSELRELVHQWPLPDGSTAILPPILANLPQVSLDDESTHYALGPAAYVGSGGALPPALVGFDLGVEAVTASYKLRSGPATLTLLDYPTPQIAAVQEAKLGAFLKAGNSAQSPWPKPLMDSDQASLEVRRSGPLVALVSGDATPEESHKLLSLIHFEADLTSVPQPSESESEISKTAKLLTGIAGFVLVGSLAAILLGLFLGGGRALYRIARGRPVSSVYEEEFTSLNLRD